MLHCLHAVMGEGGEGRRERKRDKDKDREAKTDRQSTQNIPRH